MGAAAGVRVSFALQGTVQDTVAMGNDNLRGIGNLAGGAYVNIFTGDAAANVLSKGSGDHALTGGEALMPSTAEVEPTSCRVAQTRTSRRRPTASATPSRCTLRHPQGTWPATSELGSTRAI